MRSDDAETLSAGEAAVRTGLSIDTLRYYERERLLPPVGRSSGGHRRYGAGDLQRLAFLLNLRATGMPLAVMRTFARLRLEGEPGRQGRLQLLLDHRATVRERLSTLHLNLHVIDVKIDRHRRILRERGEAAMPEHTDSNDTPTFAFIALHHTQLAMPRGEEAAARAFYAGALGMTELQKPPVLAARGGCWFRGGGLELHLGVEDPFIAAKKAHPGLLIDNLSGLAAALERAGRTVTWDGDFPGYSRFYAHDPFGNRLEFLEPEHP
jgi:DNA-binding transcriptional MerR regulator/catechol 2,3-dioxygenase-like lactoylglutathione lyase family enzyme